MKKGFAIVVLLAMVLAVFASGMVHAEGNETSRTDNSGRDSDDSSDDGTNDSDDDVEDVDDAGDDTVSTCPVESILCAEGYELEDYEDENGCERLKCVLDDDAEEDDEPENETDDDSDEDSSGKEGCIDSSQLRNLNDLQAKLKRAQLAGDRDAYSRIKADIEKLTLEIREKKARCDAKPQLISASGRGSSDTAPSGVAVGVVCEVPEALRAAMDGAWTAYKEAISEGDREAAGQAKETIKRAEEAVLKFKETCRKEKIAEFRSTETTQSGSLADEIRRCQVPSEVTARWEEAWANAKKKYVDSDSIPVEVRERIAEIEDEISKYKAKCNTLPIATSTKASDVAVHYRARIAGAIASSDDPEAQISALKELRHEIDETIKNLIQERKKIRFSDVEDVVDEVTLTSEAVEVGDTTTETEGVEVETEVDGEVVTVSVDGENVVVTQEGVEVKSDSVSVNAEGLSIEGAAVKFSPKAAFAKAKSGEKRQDNLGLRLEKDDDDRAVYRANYEAHKRLLGFIPVIAQESIKIDAESGNVTGEDKPWWSGLASDVPAEGTAASGAAETATE